MRNLRLGSICVLSISLLLSAGCGGGAPRGSLAAGGGNLAPAVDTGGQPNPADQGRDWVAQGLPSLQEVAAQIEARQSSFTLEEGHHDGSEFDSGLVHNNVIASAPQAIFTPDYNPAESGNAGLGVALYTFSLPDYNGDPVVLNLSWSDRPDQGQIFLGLSNWGRGTWQWFSVPAGDSLTYPDFGEFRFTDNLCVAAVVLTGSGAYILDGLQFVVQQPPVADLQVDVDSGQAPLTVNFDASASSDADGSITDYEWDLDGDGVFNGDGAEADARGSDTTSYEYTEVGSYTAKVRVTDNSGAKDVAQQEINVSMGQPPVADLQASPTSGDKPLLVSFDASGSFDPDGSIVDYEWDFDGDGNFNESNNGEDAAQGDSTPPAFTYVSRGDFTAVVRVTDNNGDKDTDSAQITVTNSPPTADLQASPLSGPAPLSVDLDASGSSDPGGSITDYEWDIDGDGNFNESGYESDSRGDPTPATFEFQHPGTHHVRVRVTDDDGAQDMAQLDIEATNDPPTADLQSDVQAGDAPLAVTFDASGSNDTDGSITDYEWDFDGDGVFNETGAEGDARGDSTPPAYNYTDPGNYDAKVRVSDNFDATDTATLNITVHGWVFVTVDDATDGNVNTLQTALIDGHPALAYRVGNTALKYARSTTTLGASASDWTVVTIPTGSVAGPGKDLCFTDVGGHPVIAYSDSPGTDDLMFQSASGNGTAGDWIQPVTVDSNDGANPEVANVGGNPAIAYDQNSDLYYTRSSTSSGSQAADWSTPVNIQGAVSGSANGSYLAVVNSHPAVAYYRYDGSISFEFCRSSTATGTSASDWSTKVTVSSTISMYKPTMITAGGNPAVAFIDVDNNYWDYIRASDANGGSWGSAINLHSGHGDYYNYNGLATVGGYPTAVAFNSSDNALMFTESSTTSGGNGGDWSAPAALDTGDGTAGYNCEVIDVGGRPGIGFTVGGFPSPGRFGIRL